MPTFNPLSRDDEMRLIATDTKSLRRTIRYLRPLIDQVVQRSVPRRTRSTLRAALLADIPIALQRFHGRFPTDDAPYRFSTYFTWYIARRINDADEPHPHEGKC